MHIFQAVIMGIVQGLSEFLPISSSAHLVITSNLYKVIKGIEIAQESSQEIFCDIMLHFGTLVAVLIFFRKEIFAMLNALVKAVKTGNFSDSEAKTAVYILLGTVITVVVAFPLHDTAEMLVFSPATVGLLLIGTGTLLLFSENYSKKIAEKSENIDFKTSVIMAIFQGVAALPGFSRSGLTIASGLLNKKTRVSVAKYSFLLSIPIILGASMFYPFLKIDLSEIPTYNWNAIVIGTIVSGVVGYCCIKYFLKFVGKYSLSFFGYYCIIIGISSFVFFKFIAG